MIDVLARSATTSEFDTNFPIIIHYIRNGLKRGDLADWLNTNWGGEARRWFDGAAGKPGMVPEQQVTDLLHFTFCAANILVSSSLSLSQVGIP